MGIDGSPNGSEVARLRELAERYRRLAAKITDPATLSAMRQMANDYDAEADELDFHRRTVAASCDQVPTNETSDDKRLNESTTSGDWLLGMLERPALTGRGVLLFGLVAVAVPTLVRALVQGFVTGSVFTPYLPFVLFSALLLGCRYAAAVALASAAVADFLFMKPYFSLAAGPSDLFGIGVFLVSSALIVGVVRALRSFAEKVRSLQAPELSAGLIFSEERNQAWASWASARPRVHLGSHADVAEIMKDFIAQIELGKQRNAITRSSHSH